MRGLRRRFLVPAANTAVIRGWSSAVEIYAVKRKAKTAARDIKAVTMKNGRPATRGPAAVGKRPDTTGADNRILNIIRIN